VREFIETFSYEEQIFTGPSTMCGENENHVSHFQTYNCVRRKNKKISSQLTGFTTGDGGIKPET
jgi:hypothetical protein